MNGQLMPQERTMLYEAVIEAKPSVVLEVGTWKGGGSTWQIVEALKKNAKGILYTCETEGEFFNEAKALYYENPFIKMHLMKSSDLISYMMEELIIPDFIFFDGPEDETTAVEDFLAIDPIVKKGTIFMMHDFDPPSIKAKHMRPLLENLYSWQILCVLTAPASVGLVKAIKL